MIRKIFLTALVFCPLLSMGDTGKNTRALTALRQALRIDTNDTIEWKGEAYVTRMGCTLRVTTEGDTVYLTLAINRHLYTDELHFELSADGTTSDGDRVSVLGYKTEKDKLTIDTQVDRLSSSKERIGQQLELMLRPSGSLKWLNLQNGGKRRSCSF